MRPSAPTFLSNAVRFDPRPGGIIRAESQRDSVPKPRVASRELPWEKRVVSANGVASWWRTGDTTPLGLKIARTLTQGSLADSATLGWRTQSLWDYGTTGLSVVPYDNGRAGNIRKALAEILVPLDMNVRAPKNLRCAAVHNSLAHPISALATGLRVSLRFQSIR